MSAKIEIQIDYSSLIDNNTLLMMFFGTFQFCKEDYLFIELI